MLTKEQAKADALKFLNENITAVIATSQGVSPQASTVYYLVDNDFNFYFTTKDNSGSCENIKNNWNVAVVVGTGPQHITVQARGIAEILEGEKREEMIQKFMDMFARELVKVRPIEDVYKFKDRDKVVIKITPRELSYLNLDSSTHKESIVDNYMYLIP
ncbi:MAG: pyridoxamine 5'-phosphate oxidase family protein [Candidatus Paceibacterota bacterium]|jgi:general stress protein 26